MLRVILDTLRMPRYSLTGGVVAFVFLLSIVIAPQYQTLRAISDTGAYAFDDKVQLTASLVWWSLSAQYGVAHILALGVLAALTMIAVALAVRDAHQRVAVGRVAGLSLVGAFIGALGIGCSACGAAFLTSVIGVSGATWVAGRLPLHGTEFSLLGMLLLLGTIRVLANKCRTGAVCAVR